MRKKVIIVLSMVVIVVMLALSGIFLYNHVSISGEDTKPSPVPTPIVENTQRPANPKPTVTPVPTAAPTPTPEKEFVYYWTPQYNFEEKDYTESEDMIEIQNNADILSVVHEKYYVTESENIKWTSSLGDGVTQLHSASGDTITMLELDPTDKTIQMLREECLNNRGFSAYLVAEPNGIPIGEEFSEESGLSDWTLYVENNNMPSRPDKCGEYLYLITDDIVKTAYGNAVFIVTYNSYSDSYSAVAYVLNNTGTRLICLDMANIEDYDKCSSYLFEITDEVVHLIK